MEQSNAQLADEIQLLLNFPTPTPALVVLVKTKLRENDKKWRAILNSGRKMYELGRQDEVKGILNALPKKRDTDGLEQGAGFDDGFNAGIATVRELLKLRVESENYD